MKVYEKWIAEWRAKHPRAGGRCLYASQLMGRIFPELRVVYGYVLIPGIAGVTYIEFPAFVLENRHKIEPQWASHCWCETVDGVILDPTADQFTDIFRYREVRLPGVRTLRGRGRNRQAASGDARPSSGRGRREAVGLPPARRSACAGC